jgi:hypothetical protein
VIKIKCPKITAIKFYMNISSITGKNNEEKRRDEIDN